MIKLRKRTNCLYKIKSKTCFTYYRCKDLVNQWFTLFPPYLCCSIWDIEKKDMMVFYFVIQFLFGKAAIGALYYSQEGNGKCILETDKLLEAKSGHIFYDCLDLKTSMFIKRGSRHNSSMDFTELRCNSLIA